MMMVRITFIILIFFCFWCEANEEDDLINYYENIIKYGMNESFYYELPTSAESHRPKNNMQMKDFGTYDFIVVGSGAGGAVVANRLSEVKKWKILVLEAGIRETNFTDIPAMKLYLARSKFNWGFRTTKQLNSCLGIVDNRGSVPRGKALGGTTVINAMIYSRGHRNDYDQWAMEGNPGWSYSEVLPYFIKSENSEVNGNSGYHGRGGYWNNMYQRPHSERSTAFVSGSQLVCPSSSHDYNGREEFGAFYCQYNKIKQFRLSSSKAFLEPIMDRSNLKILTNSYVTKINLSLPSKTATGVQFTKDGETFTAKASKEVILSAGVINSPQILMLSGIGPAEHLSRMRIPVVSNLPVGKTLYMHSLFYGAFVNTNSSAPAQTLRESIKQFFNDFGPLTSPGNNEAIGFHQTKYARFDMPDIELAINTAGEFYPFERFAGYTDEVRHALFDKTDNNTFIHFYIYLLKPESVGQVTLASNDPFKYPLINSNCLSTTNDVDVLYEGVKLIEEMISTEPFKKINASLVYADYPQCRSYPMGCKEYWACAIRLLTEPGAHQMCSCKMGPNPRTSVVNARAKVHDIKRLRVVDSSIIPFPLAGHPAAPTIMLAEKVSDYIKEDYGLPIDPITNVNI